MYREIMVRGWDKEFGKMIYDFTADGYEIRLRGGVLEVWSNDGDGDEFQLELMLSSRETDNNNNLIWEGDLISRHEGDTVREVYFMRGSFGLLQVHENGKSFGSYKWSEGVVVGNIYENKDLLK